MTARSRFEQDLPEILGDLYLAGLPDYRDDLLRATAATRQRPAWTFLTRWIPMDIATRRRPFAPLPWRALAVAALILILAAAALLIAVGSQRRLPPPFGPARNGPIAYTYDDDIYTRAALDAPGHVLVGGPGRKVGSWGFSPDGTQLLFQETIDGKDYLMVANADGTGQRRVTDAPVHDTYVAWHPGGRMIAMSDTTDTGRKVTLLHLDGSPAVTVDLGKASPTDLAWRPPNGAELLVRASTPDDRVDLYRVRDDGSVIGALHVNDSTLFGPQHDVSGPTYSPDGLRIAYNQVEPAPLTGAGGHFRVHLVSFDGTHDVALPAPTDANVNEAWPVWSPDGRSIAVQRFIFGTPELGWLAVVPSDGSAVGTDILPRLSGVGGIVKTWSPDGTRLIAYTKDEGDTYSIDPLTGQFEKTTWPAADLPDMQRLAP